MRRLAHVRLPAFGAALLSFLWLAPASAQLPELRSALNGVYTEEQAAAGEEVFKAICSNCHNASYPLWGAKFQGMWMSGGSLWKLYEFLSQRMPYGNGGGLTPEQYRGVTAYVLKLNGYPAGTTTIPESPLEIAFINLEKPPATAAPVTQTEDATTR